MMRSLALASLVVTSLSFATQSELVNVAQAIPSLHIDLQYATTKNLFGKQFYCSSAPYLRPGTVVKLKAAQEEFESLGFSLVLWDGYCPESIEKELGSAVPAKHMHDAITLRHCRGASIDVTLVTRDGKKVLMPTEFDDFSIRARRSCMQLRSAAVKNRELLERIMTKHGFVSNADDWWWHFDDADWKTYSTLNIPCDKLQ